MSQYINTPLLRKAVEWAEVEAQKPKAFRRWLQGWWFVPKATPHRSHQEMVQDLECGTACCIAGYICVLEEGEQAQIDEYNARMGNAGDGVRLDMLQKPAWPDRAAKYLGVPTEACKLLFEGTNDIGQVRHWAEQLVAIYGEPGERL